MGARRTFSTCDRKLLPTLKNNSRRAEHRSPARIVRMRTWPTALFPVQVVQLRSAETPQNGLRVHAPHPEAFNHAIRDVHAVIGVYRHSIAATLRTDVRFIDPDDWGGRGRSARIYVRSAVVCRALYGRTILIKVTNCRRLIVV